MKVFVSSLLITLLLVVSCKSNKEPESFLEKKISNEAKIEHLFRSEVEIDLGMNDVGKELIFNFYQKRGFKPLWIKNDSLSETGRTLQHYLKNPILFGLSHQRLGNMKWSKEYDVENEIIITYLLAQIHQDLKFGLLDSSRTALKPIHFVAQESLDTLYDFPSKSREIAKKIIAWGSKDTNYQMLAHGLFDFASTRDLSLKKMEMPLQKEDSVRAFEIARKILIEKQYILDTDPASQLIKGLKKFQADHGNKPDGIIGKSTIEALTETDLQKCQRTALAMEKWRWKNAFPKRFIWINIPEYALRFYDDDTLRSVNKVIVGKFENQTPEFSAKLHAVVVYPYWNVPYSITSKEFLPIAKNDPSYFERNHIKLFKKEKEIDPYLVNWKKIPENTFPYKAVQEPGLHNSLGILKLEFHNNYSVYIHDTPNKKLFNTIERSYSHGCVRCEKVVDLGKTILFADQNIQIPDSLDTLLARKMNFTIPLKKRIPIYLDYITVVPENVKGTNYLVFLKDIYAKDKKLLSILF